MAKFVDPSLIINKIIFESVQDIAVCSICTGLVIEAKQCGKCENCFCRKCIDSWCIKSYTCPFKCLEFTLRDPTRCIKKILSRLVLQCPKNCTRQINYDEIISHINECTSEIVDCPTCGSKVSDMSLKRESYIELQIENKILKNKIEVLEQQLQNINLKDYNFSLVEDALLNVENNLQKNNKKIIKPYNNKLSTSAYEIHSSNLKITFKFACCNKDYDCLDCHNTSEQHSGTKPICINCLECMHTSYNINDTICYYCGISFAKEKDENVKLDVIKYKNFNKKNIRQSNEETSQKRKNLKTQKTEKFEKIERIENRKKNIKI